MVLTLESLNKICESYKIPKDVKLYSDSEWECCETKICSIWYSEIDNALVFRQNDNACTSEYIIDNASWHDLTNNQRLKKLYPLPCIEPTKYTMLYKMAYHINGEHEDTFEFPVLMFEFNNEKETKEAFDIMLQIITKFYKVNHDRFGYGKFNDKNIVLYIDTNNRLFVSTCYDELRIDNDDHWTYIGTPYDSKERKFIVQWGIEKLYEEFIDFCISDKCRGSLYEIDEKGES